MAGISERTLYEYMQDSEFLKRYQDECNGVITEAARQAQQNVSSALETLRKIMTDKTVQPSVRVSASRSVLEYALKLAERSNAVIDDKRDELDFGVF